MATRMLPNAVHFKEFVNDPVTGHHYTGTCGETALATAMVCSTPQIESTQDAINLMTSMTREMMALKWADSPQGSTTTSHLRDEAHRRGFTTEDSNFTDSAKVTHPRFIGYSEPLDMTWLHEILLAEAGVRPIVLEVARAGNLDSFNGGNDERGVEYHFICVVGIDPDGYWCNDGDNSAISSHLVLYPWSEIQQARPCGILILNMQEAPVATAPAASNVPTGWKDSANGDAKNFDGVLTAPNGVVVIKGFRQWVLTHSWVANNTPMAVEAHIGTGSIEPGNASIGPGARQDFRFCSLGWTEKGSTYEIAVGQDIVALEKSLATALALVDDLKQHASQPGAVVLTQQQKDDLAAMAALRLTLNEKAS